MENRKFYVSKANEGWYCYNIGAGPVEECGKLIPFGSPEITDAINSQYKLSLDISTAKYDANGHLPPLDVMLAVNKITRELYDTACDIWENLSDIPSGKYLYRLNMSVCNAVQDILAKTGITANTKLKKMDVHSVEGSQIEIDKWCFLACVIPTQEGTIALSINPLFSFLFNHCLVARSSDHVQYKTSMCITFSKSGKMDFGIFNVRKIKWIRRDDGVLYAEKSDEVAVSPAKRREVTIRKPGEPAIKKTQELRWVDVDGHSVSKMSFN